MSISDPAGQQAAPDLVHTLRHADGTVRTVTVRDEEFPYPDGKLIVSRADPEGRITQANAAFVTMSGYTLDELMGQPHYILRHPDMPAAAYADMWQTLQRGDKWHGYVKNLRKDGSYYWVYATVIPNVRGGQVVGYTSVRRKPSRARIAECIQTYARLRAEETPS